MITAAQELLDAAPTVSADGKDVPVGTEWITEAAKTAFSGAITAATTVKENTDATQDDVDAAVTALNTAKDTFVAAQQEGTKEAEA